MARHAIYYFYQNCFLLVVLTCWKSNAFKISLKFHLKKREKYFWNIIFSFIWCATYVTNGLYEPHGIYVQDLLLYCTKKVIKNHNFFSLSSRGWNTLPPACSDLDVSYNVCLGPTGDANVASLAVFWPRYRRPTFWNNFFLIYRIGQMTKINKNNKLRFILPCKSECQPIFQNSFQIFQIKFLFLVQSFQKHIALVYLWKTTWCYMFLKA